MGGMGGKIGKLDFIKIKIFFRINMKMIIYIIENICQLLFGNYLVYGICEEFRE